MRRAGLVSTGILALALVACGQVEPVLLPVSMPECIYSGPAVMEEGSASLSLRINGLGEAAVLVVGIEDGHEVEDLATHLTDVSDQWTERPDWLSTRVEVRLSSAEGLSGREKTVQLRPGQYAVVCVDHTGEGSPARLGGPLQVRAR